MGADDYRQTFRPARASGVCARCGRRAQAEARRTEPEPPRNTRRFGRWPLDLDAHKLIDDAGGELHLRWSSTSGCLRPAPNKVPRSQLLDLAHRATGSWAPHRHPRGGSKKIERDPAKPQILKTIPGAGYMFVSDGR
jgi:two-component system OmpR family response regulator